MAFVEGQQSARIQTAREDDDRYVGQSDITWNLDLTRAASDSGLAVAPAP